MKFAQFIRHLGCILLCPLLLKDSITSNTGIGMIEPFFSTQDSCCRKWGDCAYLSQNDCWWWGGMISLRRRNALSTITDSNGNIISVPPAPVLVPSINIQIQQRLFWYVNNYTNEMEKGLRMLRPKPASNLVRSLHVGIRGTCPK